MTGRHVTVPVFLPHLGCPHRCLFCDQGAATGAGAPPSPEDLRRRVLEYRDSSGCGPDRLEIGFFGGTFTGVPPSVRDPLLEEASKLIEEGVVRSIRLSTRPDMVDVPLLARLKSFGVGTIELGAQSFDDGVLALSGRGHTAADTERAARMITGADIGLGIQLMPGLPGDSPIKSLDSARRAIALGPSCARIYPAVVFAGTGLEGLYRTGSYRPMALEEAVDLCAAMLRLFDGHGIPVIRMGLHPLAPDERDTVVAGPMHPAFGHLVRARMRRQEMEEALAPRLDTVPSNPPRRVTIRVPEPHCGQYRGPGRDNIRHIRERFALADLVIVPGSSPHMEWEIGP